MSSELFEFLEWLPDAAPDFRQRCQRLAVGDVKTGNEVYSLANSKLDNNKLRTLGNTISKIIADGVALPPLSTFKLGIMGTGTTDLIVPPLIASAARHGVALQAITGRYESALQDALDRESAINVFGPNAVLVALDHRSLPIDTVPGEAELAERIVEDCTQVYVTICDAVRQHCGAFCILQTIAIPPEAIFGSLDRSVPGTLEWIINRINDKITDLAHRDGNVLFDVARIASVVGTANWFSPKEWNIAKLAFSYSSIPFYADRLGSLLGALQGKSRKCIILDLDNTIWGGVIGDDGITGINMRQGDATGEAHLALQKVALELYKRGILLAVSSKNTDEVAREPFRVHPEMLLREKHIVAFQANWRDKASNIVAIAAELNIGLDSLVFIDDNPVERDQIRHSLPQVLVPELSAEPSEYAWRTLATGAFEAITFAQEDKNRTQAYRTNAQRLALKSEAINLETYLESLEMQIYFDQFDEIGRSRIAQLINKSNQYNLTTRRYTENDIAIIGNDRGAFTLQVRLKDKFGDNGMISVVICHHEKPLSWRIDTWLMSCRVLGRGVENVVLWEILHHARKAGVSTLIGEWRPTGRNALVRDHYEKLGFTLSREEADGSTHWTISTDYQAPKPRMSIFRFSSLLKLD
ncbi:HAD-IIIC family phosphatase [Methylobacterium sp. WL18]|uniref:HAD-IIIC family phosphatase n=1 Tax=Methylobacterium sp. WL18 TaxID=2603897 RepID=UPI0011CC6E1C|nr:HAD-IIIC family phosphatase [Methylobacterium sp. WL18]TXN75919.1 HAD-IIIC family phosphatase [Methylobacterium sp. WL18]